MEALDKEKEDKLEAQKKAIRDKFTMGAADEAEMRNELKDLMQGGQNNYEQMMNKADKDKKNQDESL